MGTWTHQPGTARRLLRAVLTWLLSALILLSAAALILARITTGSEVLGYISSAISFLCAAAAGFSAAEQKGDRQFGRKLLLALFLTILLLTIGFLTGNQNMEPSGILSVASFTVSGVLFGSLLLGSAGRGRRKRKKGVSVRT